MKKLSLIFILFILSCKTGSIVRDVDTKSLNNQKEEAALKIALSELYELYTNSDKTKTSYEVCYNPSYGWNWNVKKQIFFYSSDGCEWGWVYGNVDEAKILEAIQLLKDNLESEVSGGFLDKVFTPLSNAERKVALKNDLCSKFCRKYGGFFQI